MTTEYKITEYNSIVSRYTGSVMFHGFVEIKPHVWVYYQSPDSKVYTTWRRNGQLEAITQIHRIVGIRRKK